MMGPRPRLQKSDTVLIIPDITGPSMTQIDVSPATAWPATSGGTLKTDAGASSRIGPLVALGRTLSDLGFKASAALDGSGFDPAYFSDPDLPITYEAGSRLLNHCAELTGCAHFGLLLAEGAGAEIMGLPGLLLMSAGDLGTGLHELVRTMDLHDRGAVLTLAEDRDVAVFGYTIVAGVAWPNPLNDIAMRIACNMMRGFFGDSWSPAEVLLPRQPPEDPTPWQQCFRAPVRFGAKRCEMRFPAHWLRFSLPAANPTLHRYLQQEAGRLKTLLGKGLVDEVHRMVRATVASPPCTAARVARLLGLHERTLNRRLQADGTTFRRVRNEVLYSASRQMLGATTMNLAEVASALGYADASAFIHAFTRWSGQTPDQWRRAQQRAPS